MTATETERAPYVGQRIKRFEDPKYLRGRATYVDDVEVPGLLHAAFVRSPYAHARVTRVDAEAAKAAPGVVDVIVPADVEGVGLTTGLPRDEVKANTRPALPGDRVRSRRTRRSSSKSTTRSCPS